MSKAVVRDIDHFIDKYRLLGDDDENYDSHGVELGLFYEDFYILKYFYSKFGFDLDKLINARSFDEYKDIYEKEFLKVKTNYDYSVGYSLLPNIFEGKEEILNYIKNLDLNSFDAYTFGSNWHTSEYIDSIIDFSQCKNVLSIFDVFYSKKLRSDAKVKVITHEIQFFDVKTKFYRLELLQNYNYKLEKKFFPISTNEKYDFVFMTYSFYDSEGIDKSYCIRYDEEIKDIEFVGEEPTAIISKLLDYITPNGKAILNVPLSFVSKLGRMNLGWNHENKNYIEKIVFQPIKKEFVKGEYQDTVYVYLVLSNNLETDDLIEMIDLNSNKKRSVSLNTIIANNYNINPHLYFSQNAKTRKMYELKNSNIVQKKIIDRESEFIDKLIDEFDFNEDSKMLSLEDISMNLDNETLYIESNYSLDDVCKNYTEDNLLFYETGNRMGGSGGIFFLRKNNQNKIIYIDEENPLLYEHFPIAMNIEKNYINNFENEKYYFIYTGFGGKLHIDKRIYDDYYKKIKEYIIKNGIDIEVNDNYIDESFAHGYWLTIAREMFNK